MKHFRKTIAATITAIAVAGVTMASAPAASAGVIPEPEFRSPVGTWTTYGGLTSGDLFIGRSLDPESIESIDNFENFGDQPLTTACWYLDPFHDEGQKCIDVALAAIRQEQQLYAGQLSAPSWMRVVFSQSGYVTYLFYPSGDVTWYPTQYSW